MQFGKMIWYTFFLHNDVCLKGTVSRDKYGVLSYGMLLYIQWTENCFFIPFLRFSIKEHGIFQNGVLTIENTTYSSLYNVHRIYSFIIRTPLWKIVASNNSFDIWQCPLNALWYQQFWNPATISTVQYCNILYYRYTVWKMCIYYFFTKRRYP